MNYLVTGSAGFIGGHLLKALRSTGHDVARFDIKDNTGDIRVMDDLLKKSENVDGIFHLAAIASVQESINDPERTFTTNVTGTLNIFEAAHRHGIPVVYASSAAVYGDNQALPLKETEPPQPLSPYADHKLRNEQDAKEFGVTGLKSFGVRFFNIYGPGQNPASPYSGVISVFHDRLKANKPLCIYGDGMQTRDFVAVADAVESLIHAMENVSAAAPVANICTGQQTTLLALAKSLGEALNVSPVINHEPARAGDIRHSCGDGDLLRKLCGFQPSLSLSQGLKRLAESA